MRVLKVNREEKMKILKNILTIMVIIILLFGLTDIYAYDGLVDAESEITISETLVNGNGEISLTRNIKCIINMQKLIMNYISKSEN